MNEINKLHSTRLPGSAESLTQLRWFNGGFHVVTVSGNSLKSCDPGIYCLLHPLISLPSPQHAVLMRKGQDFSADVFSTHVVEVCGSCEHSSQICPLLVSA